MKVFRKIKMNLWTSAHYLLNINKINSQWLAESKNPSTYVVEHNYLTLMVIGS